MLFRIPRLPVMASCGGISNTKFTMCNIRPQYMNNEDHNLNLYVLVRNVFIINWIQNFMLSVRAAVRLWSCVTQTLYGPDQAYAYACDFCMEYPPRPLPKIPQILYGHTSWILSFQPRHHRQKCEVQLYAPCGHHGGELCHTQPYQ